MKVQKVSVFNSKPVKATIENLQLEHKQKDVAKKLMNQNTIRNQILQDIHTGNSHNIDVSA